MRAPATRPASEARTRGILAGLVTTSFAGLVVWLALIAPLAWAGDSVMVLPADGRGTPAEMAWVGQAVAEVLPRDLAVLGVAVIDGAERRRVLGTFEIPNLSTTLATSIRVAEVVGVGRVVAGSYTLDGSVLTLSLRLLDVERGTLSSPLVASAPLESLRGLIHDLAWDVALAGDTRPKPARDALRQRDAAVPFETFRLYCEAQRATDNPARLKLLRQVLLAAPAYDDALLALGATRLEAREFEPALDAFAKVPGASSLARRARFLQGVALYELGRYREAASLFARLVGEAPSAAALNNHGLALLRAAGGPAQAVQVLRAASELEPGSTDLSFNLAWALLHAGDAEAAAFWLRGIARQDLRDVHARVVLSWALRRKGRSAEADEEWRAIAALAPSYEALAHEDLRRRFERLRPSETPLANREARHDAELAAVHAARAERLLDGGDAAGALAELVRAVQLDPYGARAHRLLSRVHAARGEREQAVSELQMSLWCRADPAVRVELAALLRDLGRTAEARREVQEVLKADPGHAAARVLAKALGP